MGIWQKWLDYCRRNGSARQEWVRQHPWFVRITCSLQGGVLVLGAAGLVLVAYERPETEFWYIVLAAALPFFTGIGMSVLAFWWTRKSLTESQQERPLSDR